MSRVRGWVDGNEGQLNTDGWDSITEGNRRIGSKANNGAGDAERLTDGSFHEHCFGVGGTGAVSSGVNGLDAEHVVFPALQAVTHEPEDSGCIRGLSIHISVKFWLVSSNTGPN